ncbi:MAG: hypothetical protein VSS52_004115 [Thiotrichaceae bacterium]|nr:hypothetical protein [Thiotrichaceae bacterium]
MQLPQLSVTQEQQLGMQGIQLFIACDPSYFHEHATVLAYSLDIHSPNHSLHFHIFGDDKNVMDKIQELKKELKNTFVTWSYEGVNFEDKNSQAVYCSCVRFIRLTQLISHFKIPILSLDADSLIINPINNLNDEMSDADIALRTRLHVEQVQFKFLTSTVFFKPTQATFSFLNYFSQLIANAITTGKAYWYLDQVSFYQAYQNVSGVLIRDISVKYADWEFDDNSCIWAGKGPRKHQNAKYLEVRNKVIATNASTYDMSNNFFLVPPQAEQYILLQRTTYPTQIAQVLSRENDTIKFHKFYPAINNAILGKIYYDDMLSEFETLKPYLPQKVTKILDIGCGIAGIDALLDKHYKNSQSSSALESITLLDKNGFSKIYYNFEDEAAHYNSLDLAQLFLRMNDVSTQIDIVDIDNNPFPTELFDFVISLISWGFHYPVSTYLELVYENMSENGILILDVRKNQGQEALLATKFKDIKVIHDLGKAQRFLLRKITD